MDTILAPGVALINRMRYPVKFLVVTLIMLIPMVVMGYLLISEVDEKVESLKAERIGLENLGGIRPLLQHIPQHRGMSGAFLNGDEGFRAKMASKQSEIDGMFDTLQEIDKRLGAVLQTGDKVSQLKNKWTALKRDVYGMTQKQRKFVNMEIEIYPCI